MKKTMKALTAMISASIIFTASIIAPSISASASNSAFGCTFWLCDNAEELKECTFVEDYINTIPAGYNGRTAKHTVYMDDDYNLYINELYYNEETVCWVEGVYCPLVFDPELYFGYIDIVQAYLDEHHPELKLKFVERFDADGYLMQGHFLNYDENVTFEEKVAIATEIKKATGICAVCNIAESAVTIEKYERGDVDGNGSVGITDAVAVMAYVTNSEKYPLNEKGLALADVYGDNDGVNNMDALEIQKYLANII